VALWAGVVGGGGCAAGRALTGSGTNSSGSGGASSTGPSGSGGSVAIGSTSGTASGSGGGSNGAGGFGSCAKFTAAAQQAPAAMLILLQGSSSMNLSNKWPAAQQAVATAIDDDVFDSMSLGLMTFPSATPVTGPACIFGTPVFCGTFGLPEVPVAPAGMLKSTDSSGVRHDIYQFLVGHSPIPEADDPGNSTPLYDAMNNAYTSLSSVSIDKRILAIITDGGGSCTSISQPQRPYYPDGNDCPDWEQPATVNALISKWQTDATTPIDTFIVGVPGSNSHGESECFPGCGAMYDTAPYSMLLALSTYAVSGSPTTVDPTCDSTLMFTQTGADPAHPCHIDLSNGNNFNATALASAITTLRGKALGCVYDLPAPPPGQTIDPSQVNVIETIGAKAYDIPRRKSQSDTCLVDPCWDYDAQGKVDLIGIACSSLINATMADVQIVVGCATILN
jgi:hypothetical protein